MPDSPATNYFEVLPMYRSRLLEVIETTRMRGAGVVGDPVRCVTEYWSKDGRLLAEHDPVATASTTVTAAEPAPYVEMCNCGNFTGAHVRSSGCRP